MLGLFLLLQRVPQTYPPAERPIPPPEPHQALGGGLDGFESPYLGHTGSWNGRGGAFLGSKLRDMDVERSMGLRWTFMTVHWSGMEPDGPVDLSAGSPPAWRELDAFVIAARERGLNVLMQAPVVGGNAGGPPRWAGRRKPGRAAPANMEALAAFAEKLAARYAPGGTLARRQGWGTLYGVRAWEIDNEPADYMVNWSGQAADYAEFVTRAAAEIKKADRKAVIVAPALATGSARYDWLAEALGGAKKHDSAAVPQSGKSYSIGTPTDVVSFHIYEGLDTAFSGRDRTIERAFTEVREVFERYEQRSPGFTYRRKEEYWHTEGSFDFIGALAARRRAAWRIQFFTRAFAAGIRKVVVMDASPVEQEAVRGYIAALPDPFPMLRAADEVTVSRGKIAAFRHPDRTGTRRGQVWVLWSLAGSGDTVAEVPVSGEQVEIISTDGSRKTLPAAGGRVRVELRGDEKMAPPVLIVDRPVSPSASLSGPRTRYNPR